MLGDVTLGTAMLGVAAFGAVVATALLLYEYLAGEPVFHLETRAAAGVATLGLVAAQAYLTYQFVVGDYTNAYVWRNSADYLPLLYKLTGPYSSNEGSILLWATLAAVIVTWTVYSDAFAGRGSRLVQSLSMGVVAGFAVMLVTQSPFVPIESAFTDVSAGFVPPDGDGLNPLLVDPFMAIHPPITFSAYALLIVPFALGVTHFVSLFRDEPSVFDEWFGSALQWLRVAWLLLTAAVTLGGLWAYRVLGWGGFWSWDPVETAVLIPWLGLTATLHALNRYRTDSYPVFAPAAAATMFPLVVYATVVVRSDVFRSVHSFAAGGIGTGILVMLGVTGTLAVGLPFAYWLARVEHEETDGEGPWLTRRTVYHGAILSFGMLAFVSLWGLTFPVLRGVATGVEVSVDAAYYNLWSYPVVLATLLAGGTYALLDVGRRRLALWGTVAVAAVTLLAGFVSPSEAWVLAETEPYDPLYYRVVGGASVLSVVPPAAFFQATWLWRYVSRVRGVPSRAFKARETGVVLVHVGAVVVVVAVSFVYLFASSASVTVAGVGAAAQSDQPIVQEVPDSEYEVRVTDYEEVATPPLTEAARTPSELLAVDSQADFVRGEVTAVDELDGTALGQLDGSGVWLAATDVEFEVGSEVIARGTVLDGGSEAVQKVVFTDGQNLGPVSDPPTAAYTPRVQSQRTHLQVYRDGQLVTEGVVAQQQYASNPMSTNDVLIERGLSGDTYVVGTYSGGAATITVTEYPLANQIWFGAALMVVGMVVLVFAGRRDGSRQRSTA